MLVNLHTLAWACWLCEPLHCRLRYNGRLRVIFFSGNQMGDEGARILAKALQINTKLR